ncbi:MAG: LEA type 2 family protein [Candidatus Thiodiazotropha sp. (ex Dulcina madagascariensis)]|nr:LEA type 2 family protein [Candidatus Thiodiazotropha sp. (ex Dulcina madagascariensis)]
MEHLAGPRPAARHPCTHSALLLSLLLLLSACAGMQPQSERTKVTLSDIHPLASTLVEQRYLVKLRLQNRSRQPLEINGASFDLDLNGKAFASGVSNQAVTVEPFGEALLEIKVSGSLFGVIRQVQSLQKLEDKPFQYRISGSLSRPNSLFNLSFNESGEIDLRLPVNPY